jgi:hypothetical protein
MEKLFQLMIAFGELFTVSVFPTVRALTCPATVFMPLGSTCARSSAAPGQKLSSEQAVRARTSWLGEGRRRRAARPAGVAFRVVFRRAGRVA